MPRVVRTRSKTYSVKGKISVWANAQDTGPPTSTTSFERQFTSNCSDMVGRPVTDSGFTSVQRTGSTVLNGTTITDGNRKYVYETYPAFGGLAPPTVLPPPSGWQLDLIAGTNPSRPVVTPPELLQNLIELPKLLRDTFAFLANPRKRLSSYRNIANDFLAFKFGWMPFVDDLSKLLDLQTHIIKRSKEINQLYSGKGTRRRLRFGSNNSMTETTYSQAYEGSRKSEFKGSIMLSQESWGTSRWHPTTPPRYHPDDARFNQHIKSIVLGMTSEGLAKGLWAVIPWTWLLGWFTNVGKYTLLYSNTVPATVSHLNFMSKASRTSSFGAPKHSGVAFSSLAFVGTETNTLRTRIASSGPVLPGLSMPYLDIGRLSVLSALAVQRIKR